MKVKHAVIKAINKDDKFDRTYGQSLFGDAVWEKQQEMTMRIVGHFEQSANYPEPMKKHVRQRVISEKLNRLLKQAFAKVPVAPPFDAFRSAVTRVVLDGLEELDPQVFHNFAHSIEAAQRVRRDGPVHNLHTRIHRLTEVILVEQGAVVLKKRGRGAATIRKGKLPITCRDFTGRLNKESTSIAPNFSEQHVRSAAAKIGYRFAESRVGRPRKLKPKNSS